MKIKNKIIKIILLSIIFLSPVIYIYNKINNNSNNNYIKYKLNNIYIQKKKKKKLLL